MTPPLDERQRELFAEALITEIKAEMGRRDWSSRGLGRQIGRSSQYVSTRLDGGNPRTGKRIDLTVQDITAIASAFEMEPFELMERAQVALTNVRTLPTLGDKRRQRSYPVVVDEAAREDED